jgi:hypothetical protein
LQAPAGHTTRIAANIIIDVQAPGAVRVGAVKRRQLGSSRCRGSRGREGVAGAIIRWQVSATGDWRTVRQVASGAVIECQLYIDNVGAQTRIRHENQVLTLWANQQHVNIVRVGMGKPFQPDIDIGDICSNSTDNII